MTPPHLTCPKCGSQDLNIEPHLTTYGVTCVGCSHVWTVNHREMALARRAGEWVTKKDLRSKDPLRIEPVNPQEVDHAVTHLLEALGEDTSREGLLETPARVAKFYREHFDREPVKLTSFENEGTDELIIQTGIPFYSLCEHHMVPFFGTGVVAYLPGKRIVGLSKLARLVQYHASGLQNQERITGAVADALSELEPRAVGVVLKARHLCMEMRGVKTQGAETITSDLRGLLRENAALRAEFLSLARG